MSNRNLKVFDRSRIDPKRFPVFGLFFRRYAPFKRFGSMGFGNFEGDNRQASTSLSPNITSRTYAEVMFDRRGVVYMSAGSSGTTFYPYEPQFSGPPSHGHSNVSYDVNLLPENGPDLFGFYASTAGKNPLVPKAPNIDTYIKVVIDFGTLNRMKVTGEAYGDKFPNLEVFLMSYGSKRTALLLDGQTTAGPNEGPTLNLGGANRHFLLARFSSEPALDRKGELLTSSRVGATKFRESVLSD